MERAFASRWARNVCMTVCGLIVLMYIGSRFFTHIDLALYGYMVGTVVFICGFFYRFMAWADRPPTKIILRKGIKLLLRKSTPATAADHLVVYRFIWNRGWYRWLQHVLLGWGCILSAFVTFPLVFGWMYFTMADNGYYTVVMFGINLMRIEADGIIAYLFFNALNITAFMVIGGVCMALNRRLRNMQARAEQSFAYDFLPLYLLLFISVTGLILTFNNMFLEGFGHPVMSMIHQWSVIITLIYLPFGKLAHIPFRPMSLLARNYREHYGTTEPKACKVCGAHYVSAEQAQDVVDVLKHSEMAFITEEGYHLAELCLPCRRKYRISRITGIPTHQIRVKEANQNAKG
ncbi:conserved hypothetical protein [Paenibacillus curdlanolyticus YK9]|uniref:Uncharacterized protein n=1 Tax=Paenibacillus curdlanolyticus YK9 TaxID=717606 RepID=E0I5F1_9BACL|nr:hypothetical protein [Paenibacillus curdlanolyticus]EFM12193.1 conserved hypothetical protein [Paenibacillus curdlanolyticus YK9]